MRMMMKTNSERPILFSTPMVQAILDGRKTMTRRAIKLPFNVPTGFYPDRYNKGEQWTFWNNEGGSLLPYFKCPYGQVGDVLWVRETWSPLVIGGGKNFDSIAYKANGDEPSSIGWKPSIFMPKSACRLKLRITSIRVERLNEISEKDAKKEGVEIVELPPTGKWYKCYTGKFTTGFSSAISSFRSLWESINGKESWIENPWVWVIEFEVIK